MFWEKNKNLIILITLWILVSVYIIFIACLSTKEMIEAWGIITLVFVTMFYAIQTRNLAEQERVSFKDQVNKRNVDFEEKKLKEFYYPFKYLIFDLRDKVKNEANPLIPTFELYLEITKLGASAGHLITKKLEDIAVDLLNSLFELKRVNVEDEEQLNLWREKVLEKIDRVEEQNKKEIIVIKNIIKDTYVLFSESFEEILTREEESEG